MTDAQREYMRQSVPPRHWLRFQKAMETGTRGGAIRMKCLDCQGYLQAGVRACRITNCALWRFRMGSEKKAGKAADSEK